MDRAGARRLLPPKQRAALLLSDVLGWRPRETAELLKTTEASVNSLLQRARKNLDSAPPEARSPSDRDEEEALRRYIAIWETGDIDAFTAMLAHDAVLSMPPQVAWYTGRTGTCNVEGVSLRRGARKWRAGRSCVRALVR